MDNKGVQLSCRGVLQNLGDQFKISKNLGINSQILKIKGPICNSWKFWGRGNCNF